MLWRNGSKFAAIALIAATLAACAAATWQQAGKSERDRDRDLTACERNAESQALAERRTTRGDYGLATASGAPQDPRGLSPLELKDRSDLTNSFDGLVSRCMRAKGYAQATRR